MKKIKINYCDYSDGYDFREDLIYKILQKNYEVEICDDPDYVFYSCFGFEHLNISDDCISIFITGEDEFPNFNLCDYAIGFDYLELDDRYFRFPLYYFFVEEEELMERKHILPPDFSIKRDKPDFCSFVVSNDRGSTLRGEMFDLLSKYKKVDSGGKYKNNIGGPITNKLEFDSKHKFSICFENTSHKGYTTEKIMEAFAARTIPIYWGDPFINTVFNPKSFINVMDYSSLNDVVKKVINLDNNDEIFYEMLKQPVFLDEENIGKNVRLGLERFLKNIIDQPIENAYRRSRIFHQKRYKGYRQYMYNTTKKLDFYIKNPFIVFIKKVFKRCLL